jgi:hypothetical protein
MAISRDKKSGSWSPDKKSGPPTWLRVMSPISNVASMKRGGKVRKAKRSSGR